MGACHAAYRRPTARKQKDAKCFPCFASGQAAGREAAELGSCLRLAERPLELPRFHRTGWVEGQVFSDYDDPDRVRQPWDAPSFLRTTYPVLRSKLTPVEELDIGSVLGADTSSFAKIVRNVLSEDECAALIGCVNSKGFTPALLNIGQGQQTLAPDARDGHRVIVDCPAISEWLLKVLRPHLPERQDEAKLVELNERCRFLCYTRGQHFAPHWDGRFTRPTGPKVGDFSLVTVQLYLHDVPAANGGATTFLDDFGKPIVACQPGAGDVLLFTQHLLHEGSVVTDGIKYTMRTEAMYRSDVFLP